MRTKSSEIVRNGRLVIPGADKCGLKRTQWETLHRLPSHEGDLADCNDSKQRRLTSMNDNESAAAPTTYVGAAAKITRVLHLAVTVNTRPVSQVDG